MIQEDDNIGNDSDTARVLNTFFSNIVSNLKIPHCVKSVRIRSYSSPHFPAFGLNPERYAISLRIQSECGKIWTRITPNTSTFYAVSEYVIILWDFHITNNILDESIEICDPLAEFITNPMLTILFHVKIGEVCHSNNAIDFSFSTVQRKQILKKKTNEIKFFKSRSNYRYTN